jgi:hypothetical protein
MPQWYIFLVGDRAHILVPLFILTAFVTFLIGTSVAMIRKFPKVKSVKECVIFRGLNSIIPCVIGFGIAYLLSDPIAFPNEYAMGIIIISGLLLALSSVFLSIAKFSAKKETPEVLLDDTLKRYLIMSFLFGIIAIVLVLFWYAKGNFDLLWWATCFLGFQLGFVLIFLFFPKYYVR